MHVDVHFDTSATETYYANGIENVDRRNGHNRPWFRDLHKLLIVGEIWTRSASLVPKMRKTNVDRCARTPMRRHSLYTRQAASRDHIVEVYPSNI